MSGDVRVTLATLFEASKQWDEVADGLDGAWHRLHDAALSDLDPDVASATEMFRETWVEEIKRCAQRAQRHSETLQDTAIAYDNTDQASIERMRLLLPWEYRHASVATGTTPGGVTD